MRTYRTLDLGDRTLAYLDQGAGAPIVFVHAFPLNATMWTPQLDHLPDGWRGLAPDLRGFQHSRRGGAEPARHVRDHAADVLGLLDAVASSPAVIVGLSMGGYVAFECWRQRPDLVAGLVLADTRAESDTDEARTKRTQMQEKAHAQGAGAIADAMLPNLLGASTQTSDPHLSVEVRRMIEANAPDAIADALEALRSRPDSRDTLPTISCPTLIMVGDEDALTPPELSEAMASAISDATLIRLPRAGHLSNLEQTAAFNDGLHGWLRASFPDGSVRGVQGK